MKHDLIRYLVTGFMFVVGFSVYADQGAITKSMGRIFPGVEIDSIQPSEVKGLYEVIVGPRLFYVSSDGRYLVQGKLIDLEKRQDLTEPKIAKARLEVIKKLGSDKMIIFKPDKPKHVVSVFTDIDCGYCRKLHSEIDQYADHGITIQYLFFPRAGEGSGSYKKAVSVWCSEDRNKALTLSKQGKSIENKTCENPVQEHMALGLALGAKGTPMLVLEDGSILPGYASAEQLSKLLELRSSADSATGKN